MSEKEPGNSFLARISLAIHNRHLKIQTEQNRMLSLEQQLETDRAHALKESVLAATEDIVVIYQPEMPS